MKKIMVVDAQGGGVGKQIINSIKEKFTDVKIIAVGTNLSATAAMLKAGADEGATGENSICVVSKSVDIIIGPLGMVIADSMLGEITSTMANAIARANAIKIFIPFTNCDNYVAGIGNQNTATLIESAIKILNDVLKQ